MYGYGRISNSDWRIMRTPRINLTIGLCFVIFTAPLFSNENKPRWKVGEELTYKVKWAFVRLGTLRTVVSDTLTIDNERVYHVKVFVDSNPTLFFVNHHAVYESYFNDDLKVFLFKCNEKIEGVTYEAHYRFDYSDSLVYVTMTNKKDPSKQIKRITPFHYRLLDGTSLLYYARANVCHSKIDTVHYLDEGRDELSILQFMGRKGKVKIKALDKPLAACYLKGVVLGGGIAGLNGEFKGWFAQDEQAPPLKAKMKVFIGSVVIELESWKKWEPVQK